MVSFTSSEFTFWTLLPENFMESLNEWAFEPPGLIFPFIVSVPKKTEGTFKYKRLCLLYNWPNLLHREKTKWIGQEEQEKEVGVMSNSPPTHGVPAGKSLLPGLVSAESVTFWVATALSMPSETGWLLPALEPASLHKHYAVSLLPCAAVWSLQCSYM